MVSSLRLSGDVVSSAIEKVAEVLSVNKQIKNPFWEAYSFLESGIVPQGVEEKQKDLLEDIRNRLRQSQKQDLREVMVEWILSLCMGKGREVVRRKLISFQAKKKITSVLDALFLNAVYKPEKVMDSLLVNGNDGRFQFEKSW